MNIQQTIYGDSFVTVNLPIIINISGLRELTDYEGILVEKLTGDTTLLFKLVRLLTDEIEKNGTENPYMVEFLNLITHLGTAYQDAVEVVVKDFKRGRVKINLYDKQQKPNILDLSNHVTAEDDCIDLAKHLSAVINDSRTPHNLKSSIRESLGEIGQSNSLTDSPEYIAKILCQESGND